MRKSLLKRKKPWKPSIKPRIKPILPRGATLGKETTTELKKQIQAKLRQFVIERDGGCFLRHYPEAGACGGRKNDGDLILQAEHLETRANSASFADERLVVCICLLHHIHWKPQHSKRYNDLAEDFIGKERSELWKRVREDYKPHKMDWKLELCRLNQLMV